MTTQVLTIPGRLPGMNDMLAAARSSKGRYNGWAKIKAEWERIIAAHIHAQGIRPVDRAHLKITWIEPNGRRDPDNIRAGAKIILDTLVQTKILATDTQKHVLGIADRWGRDKLNPRVRVEIIPEGDMFDAVPHP